MRLLLKVFIAGVAAALLVACGPPRDTIILITATPPGGVVDLGGGDLAAASAVAGSHQQDTAQQPVAPTPTFIPTPNPTRVAVIDTTQDQTYVVQPGDSLQIIARQFGVAVENVISANGFADENQIIYPGQSLIIPQDIQATGPAFKIIPDSELVLSPGTQGFSTAEFLRQHGTSFLANYTEDVNGKLWTGAQIVDLIALEHSVNPRLLLAALEYETHWISQPMVDPDAALYPMNYRELPGQVYGLYRQLDWAGKMLNTGYYGWRERGMTATLLADGQRAALDPTINAGTAGVDVWLSQTRTLNDWLVAVDHTGFFATYVNLFGDPFQYGIEPLIPPDLSQPPMQFPFGVGETWYFTGGPHGGWGSGTAWAAVDFVSDNAENGCVPSSRFARAVAAGVIARSEYGVVILDLDGDGFEGTGWTVMYLHLATEGRAITVGQRVEAGDPIGYPACESGVSFSTHLHLARRFNGEWMAADCTSCLLDAPSPPLNFSGWIASSFDSEYDGAFIRDDDYREACTCREALNTFLGPEGK